MAEAWCPSDDPANVWLAFPIALSNQAGPDIGCVMTPDMACYWTGVLQPIVCEPNVMQVDCIKSPNGQTQGKSVLYDLQRHIVT